MKITFILVRPKVAENIGFVCRAMKTMGFSDLILVDAGSIGKKAHVTAYQSQEILDNALQFNSLKEALNEIDFAIATSAAPRGIHYDTTPLDKINTYIIERDLTEKSIAIVFGSEENGLTNDEIGLCNICTYVPMKTTYPSLNLSHCVMLYAFELSKLNSDHKTKIVESKENETVALIKKTQLVLDKFGINENQLLYQRIQNRISYLSKTDAGLLLSALRYLLNKSPKQDNCQ